MGSSAQAYGFLDFIPFIPQPTEKSTGSNTSVQNSQTSKEAILSDDMIKELMGKGLTSDVNALIKSIDNMYSNPFETNPFGTNLNANNLARKQLNIIAKINQLQNNKSLFVKAVDKARESGSLDEIAITGFGKVLARDLENGGIQQIDAKELYENRDIYSPITVSELASMRMNNNSLAFDTNTLNIIENSVGSKEVDTFIRNIINEAQTSTLEGSRYLSGEEGQKIKQGLSLLGNGLIKEDYKKESNKEQIVAATNYLYRMLPDNYKNFLKIKSANLGLDPNKGVFELIQDYANSKVKTYDKSDYTISKDPTESSEDSSKSTTTATIFDMMAQGNSNNRVNYTLNTGTPYSYTSYNSPYFNNLKTFKGENLNSTTTLNTLLSDTDMSTIIDKSAITLGTQKVNPTDFSKIGVDNSQGYVYVLLPVKKDSNGKNIPDLELSAKLKEVEKQISPDMTQTEIIDIYQKNGVLEYLNPSPDNTNKLIKEDKIAPFIAVNGYASDNNFIEDNKAVSIMSREEARPIEDAINIDRELHNLEKIDFSSGIGSWDILGGIGNVDLYRSTIYLPISKSAVEEMLLTTNKLYVPKEASHINQIYNSNIQTNF